MELSLSIHCLLQENEKKFQTKDNILQTNEKKHGIIEKREIYHI
jgi:hypothetical protein